MRNYLKVWQAAGTTQSGGTTFTLTCLGASEEEVRERVGYELAPWIVNSPTLNWQTSEPFVQYIELDRRIIIAALNLLVRFSAADNLPSLSGPPDTFDERYVDQSPRDTWSNGH